MGLIIHFELLEVTMTKLPSEIEGVRHSLLRVYVLVATLQCQEVPDRVREGKLEMCAY